MSANLIRMYRSDDVTINIGARTNSSNVKIAQILPATSIGSALNLTNAALRFTAKWRASDPDGSAVFTLTTGDGITVTDVANGLATITISSARTSGLPLHEVRLVYDLKYENSSTATRNTLISDTLIVSPEISITFP